MRISVVIPSYQQADYLRATLDSVLWQGIREVEVIVRDGGSTDGSVAILREYAGLIDWVSQPDYGQAHAINEGLRVATGEIVAYLNSDDVYYPGALARVRAYFTAHPECWFLYGDADHLHADGSVMEPYYCEPWDYEHLQEICFLCQPAVFWRQAALERFGFFDDTLHFALDYDYWLRAGRETPFHYLQGECLAGSRLHDQTKTLGQRVKAHREILQVVMRYSTRPAPVLHWLKNLATHRANEDVRAAATQEQGAQLRPYYFVQAVLEYADEFGIALDEVTLAECDEMLRAVRV